MEEAKLFQGQAPAAGSSPSRTGHFLPRIMPTLDGRGSGKRSLGSCTDWDPDGGHGPALRLEKPTGPGSSAPSLVFRRSTRQSEFSISSLDSPGSAAFRGSYPVQRASGSTETCFRLQQSFKWNRQLEAKHRKIRVSVKNRPILRVLSSMKLLPLGSSSRL